jgi:hypothetical protein
LDPLDFFAGLLLGLLLGGAAVYAMVRVRGWFTSSEVRGLRKKVLELQKRIERKDRHIEDMLERAEDVVRDVKKERAKQHGS